jgi:hypothetical protein
MFGAVILRHVLFAERENVRDLPAFQVEDSEAFSGADMCNTSSAGWHNNPIVQASPLAAPLEITVSHNSRRLPEFGVRM